MSDKLAKHLYIRLISFTLFISSCITQQDYYYYYCYRQTYFVFTQNIKFRFIVFWIIFFIMSSWLLFWANNYVLSLRNNVFHLNYSQISPRLFTLLRILKRPSSLLHSIIIGPFLLEILQTSEVCRLCK